MRFLSIVMLCWSTAVLAQEFEVASIKPANSDRNGMLVNFVPGGGLRVSNATLKDLIETAYQVRSFQILSGPSWIGVARYDVTATSEAVADDAAVRKEVQSLLEKRFQLRTHRETRELPEYSLVVEKGGIKPEGLRVSENRRRGINSRQGAMTGEAAPMANLAVVLSRQLERPVVDNTGLQGNYDFMVEWTPDLAVGDSPGPSLFTALREQLGLRLEATKGPVEVIVVDGAEKPSEN
jgi:uncharacterized protein (TIGR03435 family)